MCIPFVKKCLLTMNSLPLLLLLLLKKIFYFLFLFFLFIFLKQCTITFTLISVDRVILLLKAHLLGVTRGVLYSRNVASFIFVT